MSDVVFQEEQADTVPNISIVRGAPTGMLAWLVKSKIVKSGRQGEQVMLGIAVIAAIATGGIFVFWVNGSSASTKLNTKETETLSQNQAQYHAAP